MIDSVPANESLKWITESSDEGLFFLVAPPDVQRASVDSLHTSDIEVMDCSTSKDRVYRFHEIRSWISAHANIKTFFLLNIQLYFFDNEFKDQNIQNINFSRDMLARLNVNIVFCMTEMAEDLLNKRAYDFYSHIKLVIRPEGQESVLTKHTQMDNFDHAGASVNNTAKDIHPKPVDFTLPSHQLSGLADSYIMYGDKEEDHFNYLEALRDYLTALLIYQKLDTSSKNAFNALLKVSTAYREAGDYRNALERMKSAIKLGEALFGPDHTSTATAYNNIGVIYDNMGEYGKALEYYQKALRIREEVLGPDHPDTAATYNNIGLVYEDMGDYGKALEYYQKALRIVEEVLGPDHPNTAATYNNIGGVYRSMGDYGKALEYYQKALRIVEEVLGPDHPNTAATYNNIGGVYRSMGDYDKALEYYQKALRIVEEVLGKNHPLTAKTVTNTKQCLQKYYNEFQTLNDLPEAIIKMITAHDCFGLQLIK